MGGGFTIHSALVWLKSNLAIETAFSDQIWPTWCLPNTNTSDIIVLALYNVLVMTRWKGGGGSGGPPPENFWFERSKIL